jgi:hypothetical protein
MFIPEPRKANYMKDKTYCPISLSSLMLKTMEQLADTHIRDENLGQHPLHRYQFAYQPGKPTETAMHHAITHTEEAVESREVTLGAFLDIEEAFDSTSFDIITKAAKQHGLGDTICRWIGYMLGSRKITATLAGETLEGSWSEAVHRGRFYRLCCGAWLWTNS